MARRMIWRLGFVVVVLAHGAAAFAETDGLIPRIHFSSNRYEIDTSSADQIRRNVVWLVEHPDRVLILEGHADEWGEIDYNLQLGDLRAREVKHALIQEGVDPERLIMVVSLGESRPLDERKINEAWAANRRVEFVVR